MAFAQIRRARLSLYLHAQIRISTLQASLHVADRQVDSLRFDAGISTNTGSFTTRELGFSPDRTSTGWLS
jgi:hypothetical protein